MKGLQRASLVCLICTGVAVALAAMQATDPGTDDKPSEPTAVGMSRTLNTAEVTYAANFKQGFACSLAQLGEGNGPPYTAENAGFITKELASGHRAGYIMSVNCGGDSRPAMRVTVSAVPANPASGARAFCSDLYLGPDGKILGGVINFATDGKAETCFIKGAPLVPPKPPKPETGY